MRLPDLAHSRLTETLADTDNRIVQVSRIDLGLLLNWVDAASHLLPDPLPPAADEQP